MLYSLSDRRRPVSDDVIALGCMNTANQLEAVFLVDSALRKSNGVWTDNEVRFFGRLTVGSLSLGDTIHVSVIEGGCF